MPTHRTATITIRLKPSERAILEAAADRDDEHLGAWIRQAAMKMADPNEPTPGNTALANPPASLRELTTRPNAEAAREVEAHVDRPRE